jgi:hypothetical protein
MLKTLLSSRDFLPRVILAFTVGLFLSCSAQISDAAAAVPAPVAAYQ